MQQRKRIKVNKDCRSQSGNAESTKCEQEGEKARKVFQEKRPSQTGDGNKFASETRDEKEKGQEKKGKE